MFHVDEFTIADGACTEASSELGYCFALEPETPVLPGRAAFVRDFEADGPTVFGMNSDYQPLPGFTRCDASLVEDHPECCCYGVVPQSTCDGIAPLPQ